MPLPLGATLSQGSTGIIHIIYIRQSSVLYLYMYILYIVLMAVVIKQESACNITVCVHVLNISYWYYKHNIIYDCLCKKPHVSMQILVYF